MKPETLKALKSSIAHWKRMRRKRQPGKEQPYANDCALCQMFRPIDKFEYDCQIGRGEKCPVYERTGYRGCSDTPWYNANSAFFHGTKDEWQMAASAEISFLESLLPVTK